MTAYEFAPRTVRLRARRECDYHHCKIAEPALEEWINWLIEEKFPRGQPTPLSRVQDVDLYDSGPLGRVQQRNDQHSDPTEADAIRAQRRATWTAQRVHDLWRQLTPDHRTVVLAERLDMTQQQIGALIGLRQQLVGIMLKRAKEQIGSGLAVALARRGNS